MAGSELSNQVYQAPQAPDFLGHYSELVKSIPNYGLQFMAAQKADAERATQLQQYELMKQKAKAFMELYPSFKAAQIAKLQAEAATLPYKQALLQEQAGLANARALSLRPPAEGTPSQFAGIGLPPRPGTPDAKKLDPFTPHGVMADEQPAGGAVAPLPVAPPPDPLVRLDNFTLPPEGH